MENKVGEKLIFISDSTEGLSFNYNDKSKSDKINIDKEDDKKR